MTDETQMITLLSEDGEDVQVEVIETTKIAVVNYLLVADENDDAYILKDTAPEDSAEASYEIVEDENEQKYVMAIFTELLEDIDLV